MKKLSCLFITVLILILTFSVCANAAGVSVACVNDAVQKGETLQVQVTFDAGKQVYAFEYVLVYDTEKLEFTGASGGQCNEAEKGKVSVINFGNGSKNTVVFSFKAKKAGETELKVTNILAADTTEEISFSDESFTVKIDSPTRGDADGNGDVNTTDLALLKLYLAGENKEIDDLADYNQDLTIDTTDLALLKNYLSEE